MCACSAAPGVASMYSSCRTVSIKRPMRHAVCPFGRLQGRPRRRIGCGDCRPAVWRNVGTCVRQRSAISPAQPQVTSFFSNKRTCYSEWSIKVGAGPCAKNPPLPHTWFVALPSPTAMGPRDCTSCTPHCYATQLAFE